MNLLTFSVFLVFLLTLTFNSTMAAVISPRSNLNTATVNTNTNHPRHDADSTRLPAIFQDSRYCGQACFGPDDCDGSCSVCNTKNLLCGEYSLCYELTLYRHLLGLAFWPGLVGMG